MPLISRKAVRNVQSAKRQLVQDCGGLPYVTGVGIQPTPNNAPGLFVNVEEGTPVQEVSRIPASVDGVEVTVHFVRSRGFH